MIGDFSTHERLVRDLVAGSGAAAVFVGYDRLPEARYPVAINQAYRATRWVTEHGKEIGIDGGRLAVVGNSAGGNMAAVVSLMAKDRGAPPIAFQVLFWPVTNAAFDTASYDQFAEGHFLTRNMMKWFWDSYTTDPQERLDVYASPLQASTERLKGLPPALILTAEMDVLVTWRALGSCQLTFLGRALRCTSQGTEVFMDIKRILGVVTHHVIGRRREIRMILSALARNKPLLLVGLPGVSKTTILKEIAAALSEDGSTRLFTVTGDEQLTAYSLVGTFDPALVLRDGYKPEHFRPGPLTQALQSGGLFYMEELNRAPSGVLNVMLTCLSEGYLDIPRYGRVHARGGFTVVGACNPLDDVGTGRLGRGFADRFVTLELAYQPRDEEIEIVRRWAPGSRERLIAFAVDVARVSRSHPDLRYGASIRGAIDFVHLVEGMDLDEETFYLLGCSAYAGRVRVKPTVARSAGEIIVEIMKSLRAKGDGGDAADLLHHGAPWGEPHDPGGEEPAGEEEGSDRQGGRRKTRARPSSDEVPGLTKAGGGEESGLSRSVPMVEGQAPLPSPPQATELAAEREAALADAIEVRRWAAQLVLRKAGELWDGRGQRADRTLVSEPWERFAGGELDLDGSVEGYVRTAGQPGLGDLRLLVRSREARQYLILVDHSGSMVGQKLLLAGVLAGVLAQLTAHGRGDYAVLAFDDQLSQLKGFGEERDLEAVVETILRLPEGRATDLSRALLKAGELVSERPEATDCILISDCMPTRGDTSYEGLRRLAQRIPGLYVAYVEERGAAIELFGADGQRQRFDLYEWWARRWVGDDRFQHVRDVEDTAALIDRLSGLGPGDRL